MEDIEEVVNVVVGFPEPSVLSDGDNDASDEEPQADSVKLNKNLLMAFEELQLEARNKDNKVDNDDSSDTANATMRKQVCKKR